MVLLAFALGSLPALAQKSPPPSVTPSDPRAVYIVVLNREKGAEPDFNQGGAKLLARWANRVVVELPAPALAAMQKHGRVKYVQHLLAAGSAAAASAWSPQRPVSTNAVAALSGGGTLQWTTGDYQYDGNGNIEKVGADSDGYTRRFVYDEVDRLVEAGLEAPAAAPGNYTNYSRYTYDSFGNRLTETTPTMAETLTADRNTNHLSMQGATIAYDGVGNMTQGSGFFITYDPFNNLKEIDEAGSVQKMAMYNANDERIIFCGDGSGGSCRWTLRGNGNEVLREYESGPIGNGNYGWYYLWVEDSVYRGNLLAGAQRETAEGGRLNFHLDHLGSPRLTTNAAGQKVTANEFAPFGRELTSITQEAQLGYDRTETHRFTGHERDFVEGTASDNVNYIDYMHARTYLPAFGRFLTVDPKGRYKPTLTAQTWNRYAYAANNPLSFIDTDGRELRVASDMAKTLAALRSSLPPNLRNRIDHGTNAQGKAVITVDNSTRTNDPIFKNIQRVVNSPGVVEIKPTPATTPFMVQDHNGTQSPVTLAGAGLPAATLPSTGTATEKDKTFSTTPGVTEIRIDSNLSAYDQAPKLAVEISAHALPALEGNGASIPDPVQHEAIEKPIRDEARNNRDDRHQQTPPP
jgi:RHS repeat-associated protein